MFEKYKYTLKHLSFEQFKDIRSFGLLVFLIIVLLITWSGVKAVQTNFGLQKQISQLQTQVNVQKLQNNNLELNNQYYNTDQYLELTARQNFGLAASGETVVVVPQNVALAHLVNVSVPSQSTINVESKKPQWQQNFDAWMNFLLHRQPQLD